jgi:acetyl esterase/lipase
MLVTRRGLGFGATACAAAAVLGPVALAAERKVAPAALDPATLLHPELREALKFFASQAGMPPITAENLPNIHAMIKKFVRPALPTPPIEEKTIPGSSGQPDVPVLLIVPKKDGKIRPGVVFIHGGGYILGSAMGEAAQAQNLAAELDCVVVSVDYRLAPETRFPGSLEDNYAALRWIYKNAAQLGVDRKRIAVVGGSAGGGHAAMLAIAARDRGEFPLCYQVLCYPMLDDHTGSTRMPPPFIGTYGWSAANNKLGWASLLGIEPGGASAPKGAVPARVEDVSGLPPTFIGVGSLDLFVDEDMTFAQRLVRAGVQTKLLVVPGAFHAFEGVVPNARISKEFIAAWRSELAAKFAELAA